MAEVKLVVALLLLVYVSWAGALVHHVVGGDRGWDTSSDVQAWLSNKVFRVGDKIWFIYSGGQEGVVELKSREEFDSCDVSNPIRTYTEGLDAVLMGSEGIRYFTSSKPKSCKDGLRLLVEVQSNLGWEPRRITSSAATVAGPSPPRSETGCPTKCSESETKSGSYTPQHRRALLSSGARRNSSRAM
ncbi:unnamed protein product, partial [Vitis vinifera]